MQALLKQGQGVVRIGEHIRLAAEIIRRFRKAGQDVLKQELEPLLSEGQTGRQGDDLVLHLWVEAAEGIPSRLGHRAAAG